MTEVSIRLREARERAGLTIEDLSARTKIKLTQLQAIEGGQFDRLPGEFFTRAFLRTYAREVGVNPDDIVREYDASRRLPDPVRDDQVAVAPPPARMPERATARDRARDAESLGAMGTLPPGRAWPALLFAGLVLALLIAVNRQPQRAAESGAVPSSGTAPAAARATATTGTAPAAPETISMEIAPTGEIWITASADGKRTIYRLVRPGERLKVDARQELSFRIGNAAAFEYSINGVPGRSLGSSGEVVEFQITRDNLRTYQR